MKLIISISMCYLCDVARRVIRGDYGNLPERYDNLEREGYDYYEIQSIVNNMLAIYPNGNIPYGVCFY